MANPTNVLSSGIEIIGSIRFSNDMIIDGKIEGKITSERCELKDKSRINGDIKSKVFSMEEGASLSGRTEIGG